MYVAHARSALGGEGEQVAVLPYDYQGDTEALEALVLWAKKFSPLVAADTELKEAGADLLKYPLYYGITIDLTGTTKLHGSEQAVANRIVQAFAAKGLAARIAIAPTRTAAWALSRFVAEQITILGEGEYQLLKQLPIESLRLSEKEAQACREIGVTLVEELLLLPRKELYSRFGGALLTKLDYLLGKATESFSVMADKRAFSLSRDFETPLKNMQTLSLHVEQLLQQLIVEFVTAGKKAQAFELTFYGYKKRSYKKELYLAYPSLRYEHIASLFKSRLEAVVKKIRKQLAYGVLSVEMKGVPAADASVAESFLDTSTQGSVEELVSTLAETLGLERVLRAEATSSHIPEKSARFIPAIEKAQVVPTRYGPEVRPTILFRRPHPLWALAPAGTGSPRLVRLNGKALVVSTVIGPERIGSEWWEKTEDGIERDYFKLQLETGTWIWVFKQNEQWFLHGVWG